MSPATRVAPAARRDANFAAMPTVRSRINATVACILALAAVAAPAAHGAKDLYVSLGDSYARGSQPDRASGEEGFAYQVPGLAMKKGYDLDVANFGCGGATSSSLLGTVGCDNRKVEAPGGRTYPDATQLDAAGAFIRANRERVGLVTVVIGLNDLRPCVRSADLPACVARQAGATGRNVGEIARLLRGAAGPGVPIVGLAYPNVYLGAWVRPGRKAGHRRAREMALAFRRSLNPALRAGYAEGQVSFADATRASGGYGTMAGERKAGRFGRVPGPVADICRISWACDRADIHLKRSGYRLMARLVAAELPIAPVGSAR